MSAEKDSFKIAELLGAEADPTRQYSYAEKQFVYVSEVGNFNRTNGNLRWESSQFRHQMKDLSDGYVELAIAVGDSVNTIIPASDSLAMKSSILDLIDGHVLKVNNTTVVNESDIWQRSYMNLLLNKDSAFVNGKGYDQLGFAPDTNNYFATNSAIIKHLDFIDTLANAQTAAVPADGTVSIHNYTGYNKGYRKRVMWLAGVHIDDPAETEDVAVTDAQTSSHHWYTSSDYTYASGNQAVTDWAGNQVNDAFNLVVQIPLVYISDVYDALPILFNDSIDLTLNINYGGNNSTKINPFCQHEDNTDTDRRSLTMRGARLYFPVVKLHSREAEIVARNVAAGMQYRMTFHTSELNSTAVAADASTDVLVTSSSTRPVKLYAALYGDIDSADAEDLLVPVSDFESMNVRINGRAVFDTDLSGANDMWRELVRCMPHYMNDNAILNKGLYMGLYRGLAAVDLANTKPELISKNSSNEVRVKLTNGSTAATLFTTVISEEVCVLDFSSGSLKVVV